MTWGKREPVTNLVFLGDDEGNKRAVGGLLIGTPKDKMYPEKINYVIVRANGEEIVLSGSASLSRQIGEPDIGKFIKCEFKGWGKSANGKFKNIEVNVWEGDLTPEQKAWPRFSEFATPTQAQKKAASNGATQNGLGGADDFGEGSGPIEDGEDDLPF